MRAAYGAAPADPLNKTLDGLFPTAKVVGGYDFVGEGWPTTALAPDPDPIDFNGHGTHVADIIAGKSADGTHKGMAPGATLLAVKVCSAVATSCSGVALLQGMDFALDPNGDGDTDDAVDVINMSLGSDYGQIEDDLTLASTNAVKLGVVVVVSAGNGGNKPYIVGSPSIAPGVISVAQTQVPSATAIPLVINTPAGDCRRVWQHCDGRLGAGRRRRDGRRCVHWARLSGRQHRAGKPCGSDLEQPRRENRADRSRRLFGQPEGGLRGESGRHRRADRPGRAGRRGFVLVWRR